jgi:hypothetical protein
MNLAYCFEIHFGKKSSVIFYLIKRQDLHKERSDF